MPESTDPDVNMVLREICLQMELLAGMLVRERTAELRTAADKIEGTQEDRKSTRLNSSHVEISTLSLHDALPICGSRQLSGSTADGLAGEKGGDEECLNQPTRMSTWFSVRSAFKWSYWLACWSASARPNCALPLTRSREPKKIGRAHV